MITMLICSCINKQPISTNSDITIGESKDKVVFLNNIDSVDIIILKEDSTSVIGEIKKIEEVSDNYYLMNQQKTQIVKVDKKGEIIDNLYRVGHAKKEYVKINDFSVDEINNIIVLLCDNIKLLFYDLSFNYLKTWELTVPLEKICMQNSEIYGYCAIENKILCITEQGPKDLIQGPKLKSWTYSQTPVFHKSDNKILASLECDNNIFSIHNYNVKTLVTFSYDGYEEMLKRYGKNIEDNSMDFADHIPIRIQNLNINEDTLLMIYSKDMIVRNARISLKSLNLIEDGIFIGSPSPQWNGESNCLLTRAFADGEAFPIDEVYIDKIKCYFNKENVGDAIIKYTLQ